MNEATATITPAPQEIKLTPAQEARFWAKVNKAGPTMPGMASACWVWTGAKNRGGYGQLRFNNKTLNAHRVVWMLVKGPIPYDGSRSLCVCHKCDNPSCCRDEHFFLGTHADNSKDKLSKGRANAPCGDKHGSHTKPERRACGSRSGAHLHPESLARGEINGNSKLTTAIVTEIRRLYTTGVSLKNLSLMFGVTRATIGKIIRRKMWRHIP
jgi:hypothetical protein